MRRANSVADRADGSGRRRSRRWRIWLGVPFLLFLLWVAGAYFFFVYWTDRDLREAMAAANRDSPNGWRLADIEAQREQMPDKENAALVVLRIKSLLPANWPRDVSPPVPAPPAGAGAFVPPPPWDERFAGLSPEVQLDADLLDGLRQSLGRVELARAESRKLIDMTRGRFPLVWADDLFLTKLHSPDARTAANLLRYEAALASQQGQADRAAALVRGMLTAARSVGDEPFIVSALIRLACDAQALEALERTLAQGEPSAQELQAAQALLEKEAAEPLLLQAMRGERAAMHGMLKSLRRRTTSLAMAAGARGGFERMLVEFSGPTLARCSHGSILSLMNEGVEAAKLPLEKQPPAILEVQQKVIQARNKFDIVMTVLMPAMTRVSERFRDVVGNLRCAFVALALERYRRDHGRWPETLEALVPNYLFSVPTDPQDSKPLRYKRQRDGVIVYWLGPDGTDDGGKLDRQNPRAKGSDQGFQLWDVEQRREPAREPLPAPREESAPSSSRAAGERNEGS